MAENLSRRWRLAAVVPPAASRKFLQHELASFTFVKRKKKNSVGEAAVECVVFEA